MRRIHGALLTAGDLVRGVKLWLNEERVSVARAQQCGANASHSVASTGQNQ
jgi:hypothetical protein